MIPNGFGPELALGAVGGALTDVGISNDFMKELAANMKPGSSTLFILARKAQPDKVLPEISKFGGKVIKTSLSHEDEAKLQAALDVGKEAVA